MLLLIRTELSVVLTVYVSTHRDAMERNVVASCGPHARAVLNINKTTSACQGCSLYRLSENCIFKHSNEFCIEL